MVTCEAGTRGPGVTMPTRLSGSDAESVTIEMATEGVPCGPDPAAVLEQIQAWEQAGFDRIALHQVGPDQDGFFRFWEQELQPVLS